MKYTHILFTYTFHSIQLTPREAYLLLLSLPEIQSCESLSPFVKVVLS